MKRITAYATSFALTFSASAALAEDHEKSMPMKPGMEKMGDQHKMMEQHFMKADSDRDGALSKAEWQAKGDTMFKEIDGNGDGKLARDEMRAHHNAKRKEWKERREERMERREEMKGAMEEMKEKKTGMKHQEQHPDKH